MHNYNLIAIIGPTASGKTKLAVALSERINGEVLSADSRQIYRQMNLGTGKDYEDYWINGQQIPCHLIDLVDPGYKYNVFEYQSDFFTAFEKVQQKKKWPVMCGGSGLYIEAVLKNYRLIHVPENESLREQLCGLSLDQLAHILSGYKVLHNQTDIDTIDRAVRAIEIEEYYKKHGEIELDHPEIHPLIIGVNIDRTARRRKITQRLKDRLDAGMIDEVKMLLSQGLTREDLIYYGLEYKYLTLYVEGDITFDEMFEQLNVAIHQFAKRQMTWFRRMERNGFKIHWTDAFEPIEERVNRIVSLLNS